jgi:sialic acid synthase SpsE
MADQSEIDAACAIMRDAGVPFVLLHCVSAYPVQAHSDLNLRTISALAEKYDCPVGFSDHTIGSEFTKMAVAAGACVVEKHFTYSVDAPGADHAMSIDPKGFTEMTQGIKRVQEALGTPAWSTIEAERDIVQFRRPS